MLRKIIITLLACAIPLITLGLCIIHYLVPDDQGAHAYKSYLSILVSLSLLTSIYGLFVLLLVIYFYHKNKELRLLITNSAKRAEGLDRQGRDLQARIDLLAASREVGLILNEDVEFRTILQKVLEITANLVGPREAEEVTIFLKDELSDELFPRAQRKENKTWFDDDLQNKALDWRNVKESLQHQRLFFFTDGEYLDFSLPLIADRESVGVMKIKTILEGTQSEKTGKIKILQDHLQEFIKIVSLAIKTPNLYTRTITDGLTNLFTKQHFLTQLRTFFEVARRYETELSLIMLDIDHFKSINDQYGHLTGDKVLKEIASIIVKNLRASSSVYRYGGEEIVIILPHTLLAGAHATAERLRKKIEARKFSTDEDEKIRVTVSLGVTAYEKGITDMRDLMRRADQALYRAKQNGRNRCEVWSDNASPAND